MLRVGAGAADDLDGDAGRSGTLNQRPRIRPHFRLQGGKVALASRVHGPQVRNRSFPGVGGRLAADDALVDGTPRLRSGDSVGVELEGGLHFFDNIG